MSLLQPAAGAAAPSAAEGYGSRLEMALNSGDANDLTYLTGPDLSSTVQLRYDRFATDFPEALWRVEAMELADGRSRLRVVVSGTERLMVRTTVWRHLRPWLCGLRPA